MDAIIDNATYMLGGLVQTFYIAFAAIAISFLAGIVLGLMRLSGQPVLHYPSVVYIEVFRAVPALLLILFTFFVLVQFGVPITPFEAGVLALALEGSAYIAEYLRSGVQGLNAGQAEAARCSGLTYFQSMRFVIVPQAFRRMMPSMVSESIKIIKNTSLLAVIGVSEFYNRVSITNGRVVTKPLLLLAFAGVIYFVINYAISLLGKRFELRADVR
jgi:putative glutamine transport system permease protein